MQKDIEVAAEALKLARNPRSIQALALRSSYQSKIQFYKRRDFERAIQCVKWARNFVDNVEFYAEDAGRTDNDYLARVVEAVIKAVLLL